MGFYKYLLLLLAVLLLTFGCSKKKEEAAELEREMAGTQDTVAGTAEMPVDTSPPVADVTAVPKEPEPAYTVPAGEGYTVQVAGCEDQSYAEYLVEKYSERGYDPYIASAEVNGQMYYRVRIGSFETLGEAKALKAQLVDRYSVDAWIDYTQ
ncbi:MAG: SPOR domain-containing protein [Candidatus Zixiibacteriota bacterium]|nr:MAG: SPOR domain-containing protein [candidate division Zixibacteria bacterium]